MTGALQTQAISQFLGATPCDFDRGILLTQPKEEPATEPRLDLFDETQVNNVLAANPDKELVVESPLECLERTWNQGAMSRKIHPRIITFRFQKPDFAYPDEPATLAVLQENLIVFAEQTL